MPDLFAAVVCGVAPGANVVGGELVVELGAVGVVPVGVVVPGVSPGVSVGVSPGVVVGVDVVVRTWVRGTHV